MLALCNINKKVVQFYLTNDCLIFIIAKALKDYKWVTIIPRSFGGDGGLILIPNRPIGWFRISIIYQSKEKRRIYEQTYY